MENSVSIKTQTEKLNLLIMLFVFILPALAAFLALKGQWFEPAVTNKGELLQPAIQFKTDNLNDEMSGKWLLIVPVDESCPTICQESRYLAHQANLALGKESHRVKPVQYLLSTQQFSVLDSDVSQRIQINSLGLSSDFIYIADPLGQIILRYPITYQRESNLIVAKHLLADLRKLLKLSRIG